MGPKTRSMREGCWLLRPLRGRVIGGRKPVVAPAARAYHRLRCCYPYGIEADSASDGGGYLAGQRQYDDDPVGCHGLRWCYSSGIEADHRQGQWRLPRGTAAV